MQNSLITICAATEWQKGDSNHESEEKNNVFFDEPSSNPVWLDACANDMWEVHNMTEPIKIRGLRQNNLKNISLDIPKNKIVVFTGVSGSGKSSIVFDTVAAESQRQMNETYTAWVRGRLPKYEKPNVEFIDNLNPSVIIDQSRLGGNARSTVGTISDMYSLLRLLFSRIGEPNIGPASYFSFNNPNGMCQSCAGIGKIMDLDMNNLIDRNKT